MCRSGVQCRSYRTKSEDFERQCEWATFECTGSYISHFVTRFVYSGVVYLLSKLWRSRAGGARMLCLCAGIREFDVNLWTSRIAS